MNETRALNSNLPFLTGHLNGGWMVKNQLNLKIVLARSFQ